MLTAGAPPGGMHIRHPIIHSPRQRRDEDDTRAQQPEEKGPQDCSPENRSRKDEPISPPLCRSRLPKAFHLDVLHALVTSACREADGHRRTDRE